MKLIISLLLTVMSVIGLSHTAFSSETNIQLKDENEYNRITPVQFSLFNPVQVFDTNWSVCGIRTNILFGKNYNIYGLDMGLGYNEIRHDLKGIQISSINFVDHNAAGIQVGCIWNTVDGNLKGVQLSPFVNNIFNNTDSWGAQLALIMNATPNRSNFRGIQAAMLNTGGIHGLQFGAMNGGEKEIWVYKDTGKYAFSQNPDEAGVKGVQIAAWSNIATVAVGGQIAAALNEVADIKGVQVSFYNTAGNAAGLQIGGINYCKNLKGIQIGVINYVKNGTIPFLPVINCGF